MSEKLTIKEINNRLKEKNIVFNDAKYVSKNHKHNFCA